MPKKISQLEKQQEKRGGFTVQGQPIAEGVPGFQATKNKDGREKKNTKIV